MGFQTADIWDDHGEELQVAEPLFNSYGGRSAFYGEVAVVKVFEDNVLVKEKLREDGNGRVLVVDGGGSTWCALMGDNVAGLAEENGWAGLIIYGCIRDSVDVAEIPVGVLALNTCPRKSRKEGKGDYGIQVSFAGVTFNDGDWVFADEDGVVVGRRNYLE
jgi:regulator of ribonuclease activity A